jgi:hypothetical protein
MGEASKTGKAKDMEAWKREGMVWKEIGRMTRNYEGQEVVGKQGRM